MSKDRMYGKLMGEYFNYDLTVIYIDNQIVGFKYMGKLSAYTDECASEFKRVGVPYTNNSANDYENTRPYMMYLQLTAKKASAFCRPSVN